MSEWWVGRQGANPVGPVTTDTLIRGIQENKVPEDALVCRVGEQQWQHIAQVNDLWELIHPEQFHTSVTKQPWFAEKRDSGLPATPAREPQEVDDESTRIYSVPILAIRSIESSPYHPPPAAAGTTPLTSDSDVAPPKPAALAASPAASHAATPKALIAPPRFGADRVAPAKPAPVAAAVIPSKPEPAATKAPVALGPTLPSMPAAVSSARPAVSVSPAQFVQQAPVANLPKGSSALLTPIESPRDSHPSVPLIQSRPMASSAPQVAIPAAAIARPAMAPAATAGTRPIQQRPMTQEAVAAQPAPVPQHLTPPLPATAPNHLAPAVHQAFAPHARPSPGAAAAPPFASAARPPVDLEDDTVTIVAKVSPVVPIAPPVIPAPPVTELPVVPEVEPAELFDEDFEPPPPTPTTASPARGRSTELDSVVPRPAAGTPAPPSVIITHPPPNPHEAALAHAVAPMPEETRPAIRSIRPPGMIQVSIGTLVIGALALVVLVLLVVLLLR